MKFGGLKNQLILFCALGVAGAIYLIAPNLPVAFKNPSLSVSIASLAAIAGLLTAILALWHYRATGAELSLFTGLAFGVLGAGNALTGMLWPSLMPQLRPELTVYGWLLMTAAAGGLFISGFLTQGKGSPGTTPSLFGPLVGIASVAVAISLPLQLEQPLPDLFNENTRALIALGRPIADVLPGQHPALLMASGLVAAMLGVSWLGYTSQSVLRNDAGVAWLAVAVGFLFFGQVLSLAFPPLPEYVSLGDVARLAAHLVLLGSFVYQAVQDFGARAAQAERLRISRELHDGLAQHLSLLQLTLNRQSRSTDQSAIEAAKRLADTALLEARQATLALRRVASSWDDLTSAVRALCDDFGRNNDLEVAFTHRGQAIRIDPQAEVDIMRIVHEALSNALRHGKAESVSVLLSAGGDDVEIQVRDDGSGFDVSSPADQTSVGLRSMSERLVQRGGELEIESNAGLGTTLTARMRLSSTSS